MYLDFLLSFYHARRHNAADLVIRRTFSGQISLQMLWRTHPPDSPATIKLNLLYFTRVSLSDAKLWFFGVYLFQNHFLPLRILHFVLKSKFPLLLRFNV